MTLYRAEFRVEQTKRTECYRDVSDKTAYWCIVYIKLKAYVDLGLFMFALRWSASSILHLELRVLWFLNADWQEQKLVSRAIHWPDQYEITFYILRTKFLIFISTAWPQFTLWVSIFCLRDNSQGLLFWDLRWLLWAILAECGHNHTCCFVYPRNLWLFRWICNH